MHQPSAPFNKCPVPKSTFKVSVRQISLVNKFGENDRDSLYDRFWILGFFAPVFAFSFTKLVAGENEQDEDDSTWHEDNLKRNKTGKFSRTSPVSTFQKMHEVGEKTARVSRRNR